MAVELHLPDLPEVPISLGPTPGPTPAERRRQPWHLRLRDALSTYLPLLLMALLALGTWWLVKNTPPAPVAAVSTEVRRDPDYTMTQFAIERFDSTGRLRVRVEGDQLRHYPDTDRYEIDIARIRAISPEGQVTLALKDGTMVRAQGVAGLRAGEAGLLSLRPERIEIQEGAAAEADNSLAGEIVDSIYQGDHVRVVIATAFGEIIARTGRKAREWPERARVALTFRAADGWVIAP